MTEKREPARGFGFGGVASGWDGGGGFLRGSVGKHREKTELRETRSDAPRAPARATEAGFFVEAEREGEPLLGDWLRPGGNLVPRAPPVRFAGAMSGDTV